MRVGIKVESVKPFAAQVLFTRTSLRNGSVHGSTPVEARLDSAPVAWTVEAEAAKHQ